MGVILATLLVAALSLLYRKSPTDRMEIDSNRFTIQDTAAIHAIQLQHEDATLAFRRNKGNWLIEDEKVDKRLSTLLLSVMNSLQVKRSATLQEWEKAVATQAPIAVQLEVDGASSEFEVAGNDERQATFFKEDNTCFLVSIPGYDAYLASIFRLEKSEWLSRHLFATNYRRIKNVAVSYANNTEDNFAIVFDNQDFMVAEMTSYSKDKIMLYLDVFQEVRVRKRLSDDDMPAYADVLATSPFAELKVEEIKQSESKTISIYPLPDNREEFLIHWDQDKYALLEKHWIDNLLARKSDFKSEP